MPMSRDPDVSVIVPVYNGAEYVERALDSVVRQTLGLARIQVMMVDDGSTDESPALLDSIAAAHPSVEVIHQPNSGGPAFPRNLAIRTARGRYAFFLDQDDYLAPDALAAMVGVADENGTDVVLARMKGVGGRSAPRAMYARTLPRTDVFASSAYWTLGPAKLFRTEMIRSVGLRFAEDVRVGEDLPFVSMAYLKGNGISVLADKDYIFWVNRDDASNITTSRLTLEDRLVGASRMFDMLAEAVPPGPKRDALMRRHFEVELLDSVFVAYGRESDAAMRASAFERFREIGAAYYTADIESAFQPRGRVLMRLVSQGDPERFAAYLEALSEAPHLPEVLVEGERVFLALPWFRDPFQGLPDDLFDIAPRLKAFCRVEPLTVSSAGVHMSAICRLGELTERVTGVELIARPRTGAVDATFPLAFAVPLDETNPVVEVDDTVTAGGLLASPAGEIRDLYLRVSAGEVWRERRLAECALPPSKLRIVQGRGGQGRAIAAVLATTPKGYLALHALDRTALARRRLGHVRRSSARAVRGWLGRARS
jgi:poly(ribitol-phosphate) beta-N-acetylglucosaminyltransferase